MDIKNEKLIEELEKEISKLDTLLIVGFDGRELSKTSKLPYKLSSIIYSLTYRGQELASGAISLYKKSNYLSSAILIRSLMETSSILFHVESKIKKSIEDFEIDLVDQYLMKISLGSKNQKSDYNILNCITAIDLVDKKKYDNYRKMYDQLSEYAHPNWSGTAGFFSKIKSEGIKSFGKNIGFKNPFIIIFPFAISLQILLDSYNNLSDMMPKFINKCES